MNAVLYTVDVVDVTIRFTRIQSPVDVRLHMVGELEDTSGRRVWAGWGANEAEILEKATAWLDDCHGRADHTPLIKLAPGGFLNEDLANAIQRGVWKRQAARLG
jgi:hypothetical protein